MARRFLGAACVVAAVLAVAALDVVLLAGQAPSPGNTAVKTSSSPSTNYKAPRTAWGDPDLQGNYTNLYEDGTPLERPKEFEGRTLDDVKGAELAKIKAAVQERTINNFQGPIHAPDNWWQDALNLKKGSQAWLIVDPPDGKVPPMTPEGEKRIAARAEARRSLGHGPSDSWEDRSLYDRCLTRGMPGSMMPAIYGNSYQIVQGQGYVVIRYEMIHEARVVPLDSRSHVGKNIHLDMGDARGHWEGDTLVVESTNFKDRSAYRNANADTLKLTERFTRIAPDKVKWAVTVEDPSTWTRPWTFAMPLTMNDGEPLMPYECHEGNYGLKNILSAARADERAGGPAGPAGDPSAPADER
jgi:hypothetical protein